MNDSIREMQADIYETLATRHPARTLEEQKRQRELMDRSKLIRDIASRPVTSLNLVAHFDNTKNAWRLHEARR